MMTMQCTRQFLRRGCSIIPIISHSLHVPISQRCISISASLRNDGGLASKTSVAHYITLHKDVVGADCSTKGEENCNADHVIMSSLDNDENGNVEEITGGSFERNNIDEVIMSATENMENLDILGSSGNTDYDELYSDEDSMDEQSDDDIRHQILSLALDNVPLYGWSSKSIEEAVKMLDLSPSASGMFRRGAVDLLLFFIEEANNALIQHLGKVSKESELSTEEARTKFIEKAVQIRLKMIIPYIETWPQAMKLMASPIAASEVFENGANLMDEIWYHAGDLTTDMSWYTKRGALAAINLATELFMLNDKSADYADTWAFLHRRLQEARSLNSAKNYLNNAACDALAIAGAGLTTAQNILGIACKER